MSVDRRQFPTFFASLCFLSRLFTGVGSFATSLYLIPISTGTTNDLLSLVAQDGRLQCYAKTRDTRADCAVPKTWTMQSIPSCLNIRHIRACIKAALPHQSRLASSCITSHKRGSTLPRQVLLLRQVHHSSRPRSRCSDDFNAVSCCYPRKGGSTLLGVVTSYRHLSSFGFKHEHRSGRK